jgi:hypothetical protein
MITSLGSFSFSLGVQKQNKKRRKQMPIRYHLFLGAQKRNKKRQQ